MNNIEELKKNARSIRKILLEMFENSLSGHPGSSLSLVEIILLLYQNFNIGKSIEFNNQLILSKGHGVPTIYAYYIFSNIVPRSMINELRVGGSIFQGHPDERFFKDFNFSSGSLAINSGMSAGMAYGLQKKKLTTKVYTILGDGELQEGQIWESFMFASHHNLNNLIFIIDYNKLQLDGKIDEIISLGNLYDKICSFGLECLEVNGHDFNSLDNALTIKNIKPLCIIAHTTKGKGIPEMEDITEWHSIHDPIEAKKIISSSLKTNHK